MKTFKQYLAEGHFIEYYVDWGFVSPQGKVVKAKANSKIDSHNKLAKTMGFVDEKDAIKHGYLRWGVLDYKIQIDMTFQWETDDSKIRSAMVKLISSTKFPVSRWIFECHGKHNEAENEPRALNIARTWEVQVA